MFMRFIGPPITKHERQFEQSVNKLIECSKQAQLELEYIHDVMTIHEYEQEVEYFINNPTYKIKKSLTKKMISSKLRLQKQKEEKALKMIFDQNEIFYAGYSDAFRNFDNQDAYFGDDKDSYIEGYEAGLIFREDF